MLFRSLGRTPLANPESLTNSSSIPTSSGGASLAKNKSKSLTNSSNIPAAFAEQRAPVPAQPQIVRPTSSPYAPDKGDITQPAYDAMASRSSAPRAAPY